MNSGKIYKNWLYVPAIFLARFWLGTPHAGVGKQYYQAGHSRLGYYWIHSCLVSAPNVTDWQWRFPCWGLKVCGRLEWVGRLLGDKQGWRCKMAIGAMPTPMWCHCLGGGCVIWILIQLPNSTSARISGSLGQINGMRERINNHLKQCT